MRAPRFSIVIPVYNRRREIVRALESCLVQDFTDFEIIAVDDASTDGSPEVIRSFADPRVQLLVHERNQGECPARNSGVQAARAEWILFVDSDHALKPHALSRIDHYIRSLDSSPDRFGFLQDWDTGIVTPQPRPEMQLLNYRGWLEFIERCELSDFLLCTRRATFESVLWPNSTVAPTEYHLEFSRRFSTQLVPEILATQYTDSDNRLTATRKPVARERLRLRAMDDIASKRRILERHGPALRTYAPRVYEITRRVLALSCFIQGEWLHGLVESLAYFLDCRVNWNGAGSLMLASISTGTFLRLRQQKMARSQ